MPVTLTRHARERAQERCVSVKLGSDFFKSALRDAKRGKAKTVPDRSCPNKSHTFWKGWHFVHDRAELITMMPYGSWRSGRDE